MIVRPRLSSLLPLPGLCFILALAPAARADNPHDRGPDGASVSIQISFGTAPHWVAVRGTHVKEIREGERPDYDMFCTGGKYYVYQNDHWYMSRHSKGRFMAVDDRNVPRELSRVPREHWHKYPPGWEKQDERGHERGHGKDKHGDQGHDDHPGEGGGNH
jgi:hypothetical protein